jgi:hypothetical protein
LAPLIALAVSAMFFLYVLVPHSLLTFIFGKFVPLHAFVRTKIEGVHEGIVTIVIAFFVVLFFVWFVPPFNAHPFGPVGTAIERRDDYKLVAAGLQSDKIANSDCFWHALTRSTRRQGRLLSWYYVVIILWALVLGLCVRQYGKLKRLQTYTWLTDHFLLPNVSQWHVLLTPFTQADKKTRITADILCGGTLYKGLVQKHYLDKDGRLTGILLSGPMRFDRESYLQKKKETGDADRSGFWRDIPSSGGFYVHAEGIQNINLNYTSEDKMLDFLGKALGKRVLRPAPASRLWAWIRGTATTKVIK